MADQQRESIVQAFQSLADKYSSHPSRRPSRQIDPIDTDKEHWNEALSRLQLETLPAIHQLIKNLPDSFDCILRDDQGLKHQAIAEIQSGFDRCLDQLVPFVAGIRPRPIASLHQTDDSSLEEFKNFRRQELRSKIEALSEELCIVFHIFFLGQVKQNQSDLQTARRNQPIRKLRFIQLTGIACQSIDCIIQWLTSHELSNILQNWNATLYDIDSLLCRFVYQVINPMSNSEEEDDDNQDTDSEHKPIYLSKESLQLAKSVIPIIKVSRLFCRKLSRHVLNQTPSKSFTAMNSLEFDTLNTAAEMIHCHLDFIIRVVKDADNHDDAWTASNLAETIQKMRDLFDSNLVLIFLYIIPLIPHLNVPSPYNDFQTWSTHWHHLLLLSTQNFLHAVHLFENHPSSRS
ncbi:hypothetical protein PCASD_03622 [Puccinia coronata f. sp. avenae]|uniref:Uncharacterized protein n=1 Tax=Puccinia coronata f. sp. avenae TaxID=200324 RepID=A0A2N5T684_9BASI|nr:hypothetical protein PCASD_15100 [Puccinia coronata f. sp. avenae]PLW48070.1 hypothetical protein PCASD_03622 [Puccinia coronata f. sp. avenae]